MYNSTESLKEIKTDKYLEILQDLKSHLESFKNKVTSEVFNKGCSFIIRQKLSDPNNVDSEKVYSLVIFCLTEGSGDAAKTFRTKLLSAYTSAITRNKQLLAIQQYQKGQVIPYQFYDPNSKAIESQTSVPVDFTSFSDEGVVLTAEEVKLSSLF